MAVIEICDVCGKQVSEREGISLKCSDMNGLSFIGTQPMRSKRSYKIRVCNKCIDNIKDYCREHNDKY